MNLQSDLPEDRSGADRISQAIFATLRFTITGFSAGYIALFTGLSIVRLFFSFELEWIEGAMIDQMRWILAGGPLYASPQIHFVPFAYTPLFFYLSAGMMSVLGTGYFGPRLLSIICALGSFWLILLIVKRISGRPPAGWAAAGLYAGCYALTGAWMDLAKVDSLFMLLILAGFWVSLQASPSFSPPDGGGPSGGRAAFEARNRTFAARYGYFVASGVLFSAAFFTKQLALPFLLVFIPLSLWLERGRSWPAWATAGLLIGGISAILDRATQGWFSFYTFRTVFAHPVELNPGAFGWLLVFKLAPLLLAIPIWFLLIRDRSRLFSSPAKPRIGLALGFCAALVLTSWSIYQKIWTYRNDLMPACAGLAVMAGLAYADISRPLPASHPHKKLFPHLMQAIGLLLLCTQFFLLLYNPSHLLPHNVHRQTALSILNRLKELRGEVLFLSRGYYNAQAGKTTYLHGVPLGDVFIARLPENSDSDQRKVETQQMFASAISAQTFDWVIVDSYPESFLPYYLPAGEFLPGVEVTYPGREGSMAPRYLLAKNPLANDGSLPLAEPAPKAHVAIRWSGRLIFKRPSLLLEAHPTH